MTTSYIYILLLYILRMVGMLLIMMPVMTEGLNQLPSQLAAHGTAASNMARQVAGSIGTAFLVTVMTTRLAVHYGEYQRSVISSIPFVASSLSHLDQGLSVLLHLPGGSWKRTVHLFRLWSDDAASHH